MNEATQLNWSEVDLNAGTISIPAERMKARRPLTVPLTKMALDCLQRRSDVGRDSSGYCFPGRREARGRAREGFATVSKSFLRYLAEQTGEITSPHDWRRCFVSLGASVGIPIHIIEHLTAHAPQGVTQTHYLRISMDDLRAELRKLDAVLG